MTDHDALLAAVQAYPKESAPAGILADHYDELNEPEVAHIVRSSVQSYNEHPITSYQNTYGYHSGHPHYMLDKIGHKENGSIRYAVDVNRNSNGKASISLIGPPAEDKQVSHGRRLTWTSMEMPHKEARTLVEGLLDKGHLPYGVPAKWLTKAVNKRIEQASE